MTLKILDLPFSILTVGLGLLVSTILTGASEKAFGWDQIEVAASNNNKITSVVWTEMADAQKYKSVARCVFQIRKDGSNPTPFYFQDPNFEFNGNPATVVDSSGTTHAVCMSAKNDYSEGKLEYFYSENGGRWVGPKTIALESSGIPDKPAIAISNDKTIVVAYAKTDMSDPDLLRTQIKFVVSQDNGKKWFTHVPALPEANLRRPVGINVSFKGYQGIDLKYSNHHTSFLMTMGEYGVGNIYFCQLNPSLNGCSKFTNISDKGVEVPITTLAISGNGDMALSWHNAHAFGSVKLQLISKNIEALGTTVELDKAGTLSTTGINDDGFAYLSWLSLSQLPKSSEVQTLITKCTQFGCTIPKSINEKTQYSSETYIGGYQAFLKTDGRLSLVYIDFSKPQQSLEIKTLLP